MSFHRVSLDMVSVPYGLLLRNSAIAGGASVLFLCGLLCVVPRFIGPPHPCLNPKLIKVPEGSGTASPPWNSSDLCRKGLHNYHSHGPCSFIQL